jgi:hypothetical protein
LKLQSNEGERREVWVEAPYTAGLSEEGMEKVLGNSGAKVTLLPVAGSL